MTAALWITLAGNEGIIFGDVVALPFGIEAGTEGDNPLFPVPVAAVPGGGGNGDMPRLFLSLAAAAAAADAYFKVSPGALVGRGAGFIALFGIPFDVDGKEVWRVARAGNGDFS